MSNGLTPMPDDPRAAVIAAVIADHSDRFNRPVWGTTLAIALYDAGVAARDEEIARLRAALRDFNVWATHTYPCPSDSPFCDCGLDALRQKHRAALEGVDDASVAE